MKPLYLLHIFVTCTVATNVSASCKDHLKERLPTLLDAGDGARYLANPIPTDWPQCAINGTSDPFAVGTDGTKVQFTDDFISPNTNFYCSKVCQALLSCALSLSLRPFVIKKHGSAKAHLTMANTCQYSFNAVYRSILTTPPKGSPTMLPFCFASRKTIYHRRNRHCNHT